MVSSLPLEALRKAFGRRMQVDEPLAKYTSARIGGPADVLITVNSAEELAETANRLWEMELPFHILGGGSNVLVSDAGVREVVILNKAKNVTFNLDEEPPAVTAESGANFGGVARQAAQKGLTGLEWAAGIPGTIGGAVFGNAGAHGGDTAGCLEQAEILQHNRGIQSWSLDQLDFTYRGSALKQLAGEAVVISATLRLAKGDPAEIKSKMDEFLAFRRRTQPPGASMGSMFKNPEGDHAGRLIDAAGLKGSRIGQAEISPLHGNFFLNHGGAAAIDVYALIQQARKTVQERFGVDLELEIQLLGDWTEVGR
jgi:UDP-N-acetylmuramate dehydrogenase